MIELNENQFRKAECFLKNIACDTVPAYSIIEKRQRGRIFADDAETPESVLFWHYNGFALISGNSQNNDFNQGIFKLLLGQFENNQRRFALVVDDNNWNTQILKLIGNDDRISKDHRLKFKFNNSLFSKNNFAIPAGYELKTIDKDLLSRIQGTIVPSFIWDSDQAFLEIGKGFCLMDDDNIACVAFSSFIGNGQMDIGIETAENYRRKGFAAITAKAMVSYALENGFEPVWGCAETNIGSKKTALKLGFILVDKHPLYIRI